MISDGSGSNSYTVGNRSLPLPPAIDAAALGSPAPPAPADRPGSVTSPRSSGTSRRSVTTWDPRDTNLVNTSSMWSIVSGRFGLMVK